MRQQKYTQAQQVIDTLRTTGGYVHRQKSESKNILSI